MATIRGTGRASRDRHTTLADDISAPLRGMPKAHPTETDDEWPLEVWLSREEALVASDTWNAGQVRGAGSHASGRLRSLMAALRREPTGRAGEELAHTGSGERL